MNLYPNAKINLGLNVVAKLPSGYHHIETIMYPVYDLKDEITINFLPEGSPTRFTQEGSVLDCPPEKNLVYRAWQLLKADYPHMPPVHIALRKFIPSGAGLGGGSSDASFTLKGLNLLCQLKLSDEALEEYASQLGADCPFFIKNLPTAATGLGYTFSPVDINLSDYTIMVQKPNVFVSTAEAYAGVTPASPVEHVWDTVRRPVSEWRTHLINDFEHTILRDHPEIAELKQKMYAAGAHYASMSGSGSAVYGLFPR